ncbi:MAG: glucose-6-phosphate dehydrogenase [Anaerolineales bacterium]
MKNEDRAVRAALPPATLAIFGATGDLVWRKLAPALYDLQVNGQVPDRFSVIGIGRKDRSSQDFKSRIRDGVDHFSDQGKVDEKVWAGLSPKLSYLTGDFDDPSTYQSLKQQVQNNEKEWGEPAVLAIYLATPPSIVEMVVGGIGQAGLAEDRDRVRIVVEKPFGHDLDSAVELNRTLTSVFDEAQIYRIDHYLGKETVQNILALRFANALFEPIWDRRYIDHVQITVAETVGVEHRGEYYEGAGALRDMIQNHLMQILTLIAMEPMVSFDADEVRNKKEDVLKAIRPIPQDRVPEVAVRGQYGESELAGEEVLPYRQEPGVNEGSSTETYAAVKLYVDNWRWQDVPFYLRTGKRLNTRASEVVIQFKPVPHQSFPAAAARSWQPNRLRLQIQPQEGISLSFQAKYPGSELNLEPVDLHFSYRDAFEIKSPLAYQTLLADVIRGDATLFMRADQVERSWAIIMPVLRSWASQAPTDFPNYQAGSWGPVEADRLIQRDGREWLPPKIGDEMD